MTVVGGEGRLLYLSVGSLPRCHFLKGTNMDLNKKRLAAAMDLQVAELPKVATDMIRAFSDRRKKFTRGSGYLSDDTILSISDKLLPIEHEIPNWVSPKKQEVALSSLIPGVQIVATVNKADFEGVYVKDGKAGWHTVALAADPDGDATRQIRLSAIKVGTKGKTVDAKQMLKAEDDAVKQQQKLVDEETKQAEQRQKQELSFAG